MLDALRSDASESQEIQFVVPTQNAAAMEYLGGGGFKEQRRLPRMRLGEPIVWRREQVWAIFNFALG